MVINGKTVGYAMITPAQIGEAVKEYLAENPSVVDEAGFLLTDRTTGTQYKIYVDNGKLTMEVV